MSLPEERPQTAGKSLARRVFLGLGILLLAIFAGQVYLQDYLIKTGAFEDPEQLKKLQNVTFTESAPAASGWPQWRGPRRDGVSTETGLITSWPDGGPRKLWEADVGQGFAAPVIAQGRAYALFMRDDQETVVCWKADTGEELWRHVYAAAYHNQFGNGPRSSPAIDGDVIFTVGGTGVMHCLRTQPKTPQGEVVWTKNLLTEFAASNIKWGVSFSPLVVGQRVFINPGGPDGNSIAALDKTTGAVLWKALNDPASYSSPLAATIAGQEQIVFLTAENLVGVTPDKGELLWSFPWVTNAEGCNIATPIVAQDYVFLSSGYGKGCGLIKIDKTEAGFQPRSVYQNAKMRNHFSSSVRFKDHLFGFNEDILTCLEIRTGAVRWKARGLEKGSLMIADGQLILLGENGVLALAEANPEDYKETARWQPGLERPCWSMPVLADGRLYVRDQKKLMCLDMRK